MNRYPRDDDFDLLGGPLEDEDFEDDFDGGDEDLGDDWDDEDLEDLIEDEDGDDDFGDDDEDDDR